MNKIRLKNIQTNKNLYSKKIWSKLTFELERIKNDNKKIYKCPICKSKRIYLYIKKNGFNMFTCWDCNLIFSNPYPSKKQLDYYYKSFIKKNENKNFKKSFNQRLKIFVPRVKIIKEYINCGKLLDIGPAIGIFVEALKKSKHNFSITCCDIDSESCNELKKKYSDIKVINKDFEKISSKFDVITMWDTVEHIQNLENLFKKIRKLLNKNGFFFFSTPNTKSFEWFVAGKDHGQILPPGHINLLNIKNIKILFKKNNLKLIDALTLNPSLDIDTVNNLIKSNQANINNVKNFFNIFYKKKEDYVLKIKDKLFRSNFEKFLIKNKLAGNIIIIGKKV